MEKVELIAELFVMLLQRSYWHFRSIHTTVVLPPQWRRECAATEVRVCCQKAASWLWPPRLSPRSKSGSWARVRT